MINKELGLFPLLDKNCRSCEYKLLENHKLPCFFCIFDNNEYTQWKPAIDCSTCTYNVVDVNHIPCSECTLIAVNEVAPSNWEYRYETEDLDIYSKEEWIDPTENK